MDKIQQRLLSWCRKYSRIVLPASATLVLITGLGIGVWLASNTKQKTDVRTSASFQGSSPAGIYGVLALTEAADFESAQTNQEISGILANPSTAGITLRLQWEELQPSANSYQLDIIQRVMDQARQANKSVQLILVPGFFTPAWVLDQLPSCEPFITNPASFTGNCGKALFNVDYGPGRNEVRNLPLPWNATYVEKWKGFVQEIAQRFNSNPADRTLVSIAVAGPTSMSVEMSLPGDNREDLEKWGKILNLFYPADDPHRGSNLAIIEQWENMIDFYEQTFSGITIVVTRGGGLLKFVTRDEDPATLDPRHPQESKEIIINYLIQANFTRNAKANQTSGLKACRDYEGGVEGVKITTLAGIFGGAQFNSSVTESPMLMGCQDDNYCSQEGKDELKRQCRADPNFHTCCRLTDVQAANNVLQVYFNLTPVASHWGGQNGTYKIHYLQLYLADILNPDLQSVLARAKQDLSSMSPAPTPTPTPSPTPGPIPPATNVKGVMSLSDWNAVPDPRDWTNPNISGVVLRLYWKDLNPAPNTYNWQIIDSALTQAKSSGKIVKISIAPGFYSPNWVLSQVPVQLFTVPQGPLKGQAPLPIPWDNRYLQLWFGFITKLSEHIAAHPAKSALGYISLTGPNSHNGEVALPRETADVDSWMVLARQNCPNCADRSARQRWLADQLTSAWQKTMDHYQTTLGPLGINFTLALITDSLPITGNPDLQWQYKLDLVNYPISKSMSRFGIQTNGLDGRSVCPATTEPLRHWHMVKDYSSRLTGFQTNSPTNLYNCPGVPKINTFNRIVDNALSYEADFLEIYERDIFDPQLAGTVKRANDSLRGAIPPPTPTPTPRPTPTPTPSDRIGNLTVETLLKNSSSGSMSRFTQVNARTIVHYNISPRVDYKNCMSGGYLSLPIRNRDNPCTTVGAGSYATKWDREVTVGSRNYRLIYPTTCIGEKIGGVEVCEQTENIAPNSGVPYHRGIYTVK